MERELLVFMEMAGETVSVGKLWTRTRGARETASFEYDPSWLVRRDAFGLEPMLPPGRGPFHTDRPVFNAFTDVAPERWDRPSCAATNAGEHTRKAANREPCAPSTS